MQMITCFQYFKPYVNNLFVLCFVIQRPQRQALYAVLRTVCAPQFFLYPFLVNGICCTCHYRLVTNKTRFKSRSTDSTNTMHAQITKCWNFLQLQSLSIHRHIARSISSGVRYPQNYIARNISVVDTRFCTFKSIVISANTVNQKPVGLDDL